MDILSNLYGFFSFFHKKRSKNLDSLLIYINFAGESYTFENIL